jgi:hypothetical protein
LLGMHSFDQLQCLPSSTMQRLSLFFEGRLPLESVETRHHVWLDLPGTSENDPGWPDWLTVAYDVGD